MLTRRLLTLFIAVTLISACSTKKSAEPDRQTSPDESASAIEGSNAAAAESDSADESQEAAEPTAKTDEAAEDDASETEAGGEYLRVLIRSADASKLAQKVNAELASEPGGVISGKNMGCAVSKESVTTCGQILDAEGKGYDLEHLGYDEAGGPKQEELIVTEVMLSEEEHDGKKWLRVRYKGEPAAKVAKFLNPKLARSPGAVVDGKHHSCVVSGEGVPICGFLLAPDGSTVDLEEFGYQ